MTKSDEGSHICVLKTANHSGDTKERHIPGEDGQQKSYLTTFVEETVSRERCSRGRNCVSKAPKVQNHSSVIPSICL